MALAVVTALAPVARAHASCGALTCRDLGDAAATCTNTPTGYTCTCTAGFISNGIDCVDACSAATRGTASDPCAHGTCTVSGTTWTCACQPGYASNGAPYPSCVDYPACTATATASCVTSEPGNACVDDAPPYMTYHCTCANAAYTPGTVGGMAACVDRNGCAPNHCGDGGDAAATCTDAVAPMTGYTCSCDAGYMPNGVTCVDDCGSGPDPCGHGGTCAAAPGGWTCSCPTGYVSTGGALPSCVDYDACTATATASCVTSQPGNACVDQAAPSMTYDCSCGNAAYDVGSVGGMAACVDRNECAPNHCSDGGDAAATCTDAVAPMTGYACACDAGYTSDGVTCVDLDACNAAASADCVTSAAGNACVDDPAPSSTYHCTCGNVAYTSGTGADGQAACVDDDGCRVNHCTDGGDTAAVCTDHPAPATGYDCTCDAGWAPGMVAGAASCVATVVDGGTDAGDVDASSTPDAGAGDVDASSTPDASAGDDAATASDAGATRDASSPHDAGSVDAPGVPSSIGSGCGCRVTPGRALVAPWSLIAAALWFATRRRRPRAR